MRNCQVRLNHTLAKICNNKDIETETGKEGGTHSMRAFQLYIGAIVLGVLAIVLGVLYLANVIGYHPTRAYAALGAGVILVIIGVVGMMVSRSRGSV